MVLIVLEGNSKTYDEPPNNKGPDDTQCRCGAGECLSESCKYHDHHLDPVYRKVVEYVVFAELGSDVHIRLRPKRSARNPKAS